MKWLVAVVVAALIGGCGSVRPPSATDTYDGEWQLFEGRGPQGTIPILARHPITLTIQGDGIDGNSACNYYDGDIAVDRSTIEILEIRGSEMGCARRQMASESAYLDAVWRVKEINRDGDTLALTGSRVELRFSFVPPDPPAELVGTHWRLESLISGRGSGAVAAEAKGAHLVLRGGGMLIGSTGCRRIAGDWIRDGDGIVVMSFSAEGRCPPRLTEQDAHLVAVLGDRFKATVDGRKLLIAGTNSDLGLHYVAP